MDKDAQFFRIGARFSFTCHRSQLDPLMIMKKKLAYIVLIAIAAVFPLLGACYERVMEAQGTDSTVSEATP